MTEFELDREALLQTFLAEADEILGRMEQSLVALEARPGDDELVNALFRDAHTMKGSAGLVAFDAVRDLSHDLEAVLAADADARRYIRRLHRERPDAAQEARFERLKQLRNRRAQELGLEPGVICPNGALQAIARTTPTRQDELTEVVEVRRWQVEALGAAAILEAAADPPGQ